MQNRETGSHVKLGANAYDDVPYLSRPFPQSHPDRLATSARLFGLAPVPINSCRVLELGCSGGGNLVPLAEQLPNSAFLGIDASVVEIEHGRALANAIGLDNVTLEHRDIRDINQADGQFDYIVSHGVYSWVPHEIQDRILQICKQNLSPRGVAYVSYNTYPGWRMRGMIRDMMVYRARRFEKPEDRLRQSRAFLDFLGQSIPSDDNAYGMLLKSELKKIRRDEDYYLLHEYLEEVNEPIYFHEFAERAAAHGLQYLGEADHTVMSLANFPPAAQTMLRSVAWDLIEMEQYMDFLRNRMFRQTLLCHDDVAIDRSLSPERVLGLCLAATSKPEEPIKDLHSRDKVTFRGPKAVITTTEPLVKAAMVELEHKWPQAIAFQQLFAAAWARLSDTPVLVDTSHINPETHKLAEPMVRSYATGMVELRSQPLAFTVEVTTRPIASRVAREQAKVESMVTNMRHESVRLNDVQRQLLPHLDGTHDTESLVSTLEEAARNGRLAVHEGGTPVADSARLRGILSVSLTENLHQLARQALLIG